MKQNHLIAKIATEYDEIESSKRLRHRVFSKNSRCISDYRKAGELIDTDCYDLQAEHLVLIDNVRRKNGSKDYVVGTCRLITGDYLDGPQHFYSNSEFVLDKLLQSPKRFLELGRACVDHDYRLGPALFFLWRTLLRYLVNKDVETIFGVASFHGLSPDDFSHALSFLHYNYTLETSVVCARAEAFIKLNQVAEDCIDLSKVNKQLPPLLKAYLGYGAWVGQGAFLDRNFETLDIFVSVNKSQILKRYKSII